MTTTQSCPNCGTVHDIRVYVSGQKVTCRCGIRFEVRRADVSGIHRPAEPSGIRPAVSADEEAGVAVTFTPRVLEHSQESTSPSAASSVGAGREDAVGQEMRAGSVPGGSEMSIPRPDGVGKADEGEVPVGVTAGEGHPAPSSGAARPEADPDGRGADRGHAGAPGGAGPSRPAPPSAPAWPRISSAAVGSASGLATPEEGAGWPSPAVTPTGTSPSSAFPTPSGRGMLISLPPGTEPALISCPTASSLPAPTLEAAEGDVDSCECSRTRGVNVTATPASSSALTAGRMPEGSAGRWMPDTSARRTSKRIAASGRGTPSVCHAHRGVVHRAAVGAPWGRRHGPGAHRQRTLPGGGGGQLRAVDAEGLHRPLLALHMEHGSASTWKPGPALRTVVSAARTSPLRHAAEPRGGVHGVADGGELVAVAEPMYPTTA